MRLREQDVEKVFSLAFVLDPLVPVGKGAVRARRLQIQVGAARPRPGGEKRREGAASPKVCGRTGVRPFSRAGVNLQVFNAKDCV